MLSRKDLQEIESLIVKNVTHILGEFFEKSLAPYLDKQFKENDYDHEEIFRRLGKNDLEHERMFEKLNTIESKVDGHEKRIKKLEKVASN